MINKPRVETTLTRNQAGYVKEGAMNTAERINAALGNEPADLLLKNGRLVNVFSGEIHPASIAIKDGLIIGFGDYEAAETVDRRAPSFGIHHAQYSGVR
jgi:adenine deaminase